MVIGSKGNSAQRFLTNVMLVHETLRTHGEHLRWRHKPIRSGVRSRPSDARPSVTLAKAAKLSLGKGPERNDVLGVTSYNGGCCITHSPSHTTAAATPVHI